MKAAVYFRPPYTSILFNSEHDDAFSNGLVAVLWCLREATCDNNDGCQVDMGRVLSPDLLPLIALLMIIFRLTFTFLSLYIIFLTVRSLSSLFLFIFFPYTKVWILAFTQVPPSFVQFIHSSFLLSPVYCRCCLMFFFCSLLQFSHFYLSLVKVSRPLLFFWSFVNIIHWTLPHYIFSSAIFFSLVFFPFIHLCCIFS